MIVVVLCPARRVLRRDRRRADGVRQRASCRRSCAAAASRCSARPSSVARLFASSCCSARCGRWHGLETALGRLRRARWWSRWPSPPSRSCGRRARESPRAAVRAALHRRASASRSSPSRPAAPAEARGGPRAPQQAAAVAAPRRSPRLLDDGQPFVLVPQPRSHRRQHVRARSRSRRSTAPRPPASGCSRARVRARPPRRRPRALPGTPGAGRLRGPRSSTASTCSEAGSVRLAGVPSRARVSPDGRYGAVTSFVTGHSYADVGQFSTAATIIDLARGRKRRRPREGLHDHGATASAVTAPRPQLLGRDLLAATATRFYATMATGGKTYLIKAQPAARAPERRSTRTSSARRCRRTDADRLQEGGRPRPRRSGASTCSTSPPASETPLAETRAARRPDRVARRRPRALSAGRGDLDHAGRRQRRAAALARGAATRPRSCGSAPHAERRRRSSSLAFGPIRCQGVRCPMPRTSSLPS